MSVRDVLKDRRLLNYQVLKDVINIVHRKSESFPLFEVIHQKGFIHPGFRALKERMSTESTCRKRIENAKVVRKNKCDLAA